MALAGEIILSARELIPDVAELGVLPAPGAEITASVVASAGSTLPAGTYGAQVSYWNDFGETTTKSFTGLVIGANQGIQIAGTLPPGVKKVRAYFGTTAGSERQYQESTTTPLTISAPGTAGIPPTRSTAFNPDADGGVFGASTLFRWLNEGLNLASRLCGGVLDYSGVDTVVGQPLYMLTGEWLSVTDVWYDGYGIGFDPRGTFFRRNTVQSSVLRSATISLRTNQVLIEVWPQPNRTASATTLAANFAVGDTQAQLASTAGFLLPFGFAKIGSEIVAYKGISGANLVGLIRGLGGTSEAAVSSGGAVKELNLFFNGKREFTQRYVPGDSLKTPPIPTGWATMLPTYILHKAREAEQQRQEATSLKKEFEAEILAWARANKQIAGPRQVPARGQILETVPGYGQPYGGVVLP